MCSTYIVWMPQQDYISEWFIIIANLSVIWLHLYILTISTLVDFQTHVGNCRRFAHRLKGVNIQQWNRSSFLRGIFSYRNPTVGIIVKLKSWAYEPQNMNDLLFLYFIRYMSALTLIHYKHFICLNQRISYYVLYYIFQGIF